MLNKLKEWCYHSETIAWGYIQILLGGLSSLLGVLGFVANDDTVKTAFTAMGLPPWIGLIFAMFGAITLSVRMRGGSRDPIEGSPG